MVYSLRWEPGKSRTVSHILCNKYEANQRKLHALIICPLIVVDNWKVELEKFTTIHPRDVILLKGSSEKRCNLFKEWCFLSKTTVFITNFESMQMKKLYELFLAHRFDALVIDESHKCKNHQALRTKRIIKLSDQIKFKYILTGTPILNSTMDIFSQYRILDSGKTFGKNFFTFRAKYFRDKNAGMQRHNYFPNWQPIEEKVSEIKERMYRSAMSVQKTDCLDLPPLIKTKIFVELSREQRRLYNEMREHFITYLKSGEACVAQLAITKGLRLQQIASGFVKVVSSDAVVKISENPRLKALKSLLEDLAPKHKVIIWAVFKENFRQIALVCEELGLGFVEVHGNIKSNDKSQNVHAFNNDEKVRVFIGHPESSGIGINLVASNYSIFYTRGFSLSSDLQAEARNWRGGSEIHSKVTRIDLIAKDTIDELIADSLDKKLGISAKVLDIWKDEL